MKVLVEKALASNPSAVEGQAQCCTESTGDNQLVQPESDYTFDWKVVDIVGSPRLGRLIGALTMEACSDISFLDLNTEELQETGLCNQDLLSLCYKADKVGHEAT